MVSVLNSILQIYLAPYFGAAFPASVATFQNATAEACKATPCENILIRSRAAKWYLEKHRVD